VSALFAHTSPTSLWYPLAKRTTISLVSGSLHLVVYFNKREESESESKEKLIRMTNLTAVEANDFVVMEKEMLHRVNSEDFVQIEADVK
jgi:hypothetical protein